MGLVALGISGRNPRMSKPCRVHLPPRSRKFLYSLFLYVCASILQRNARARVWAKEKRTASRILRTCFRITSSQYRNTESEPSGQGRRNKRQRFLSTFSKLRVLSPRNTNFPFPFTFLLPLSAEAPREVRSRKLPPG